MKILEILRYQLAHLLTSMSIACCGNVKFDISISLFNKKFKSVALIKKMWF